MTGLVTGGVLGAAAGLGAWLVLTRLLVLRRGSFDQRVLLHLRDLPQLSHPRTEPAAGPVRVLLGPLLRRAADRLERILGGSASVRRRIDRAGLAMTVHDFRVQQVVWGLVTFAAVSSLAVPLSLRSPDRVAPLAVLCVVAFAGGVLVRENRLTAQVATHERRVLEEMPAVAELLALSVAAGEGPVPALDRVVTRSTGAFSHDLAAALGRIRTGTPVAEALDDYASRTGLPVVARFASGIAVALERGTPLSDVLHAQAADVREARRTALIESGGRREVLMMVPVVFLVLPTTVLFAFWPGIVGLRLVTP